MRRLPLALIAILPVLSSIGGACSSDETAPAVEDGGASGTGEGGQAGSKPAGGDAGSGNDLPEGGQGEGGGNAQGGLQQLGGAPPIGDAGSTAEAGSPTVPVGGAGGAEPGGPPDLITSGGGPWPDSFTGSCASPSALISCPRMDEAFFGQDGTYRINVPSYVTTVTTLTDSVTGLVWQLDPEPIEKAKAAAAAYCDSLDLGGQTDWRLPSRLEYVTVLDEGLPNGFAMPPPVSVTTTGGHWTSSPTGTAGTSFMVNDNNGTWTVAEDWTGALARCVRGPMLGGSVQVGADTAIDAMTDLEWQRTNLDDSDRNWESALDHCERLEHAGKTDWRLPNIKELATIVDEAAAESPVVDSATFGDSQALSYWSSTPASSFGSERLALALETNFGTSSSPKMTELARARCVRTAD